MAAILVTYCTHVPVCGIGNSVHSTEFLNLQVGNHSSCSAAGEGMLT